MHFGMYSRGLRSSIDNASWYQALAGVAGINERLVTINPGMRKEQVARRVRELHSDGTVNRKKNL